MSRTAAWIALAALGLAFAAGSADARLDDSTAATPKDRQPIVTTDRTLQESLDRIARGSALWRNALEEVRKSGRLVLLLTSDEVVVADTVRATRTEAFDPSLLAESAPVPAPKSEVHIVMVVMNLRLLQELHARQRSLPSEFHADLDRIVVHEIYGHALPYLLAGKLSGRCPDPLPHERAVDACSIRRENAVRAELRLGRRTEYGLHGLACARRALP